MQFDNRIAVITGAGTGMGRELAVQLAQDGCHLALCDISADTMEETKALAEAAAPQDIRVTTFVADVSKEADLIAFAAATAEEHATDCVHLLFNNAGVGGGGSMIADSREEWDATFGICWGGVYFGTRAFLPLLLKADQGHVVNTSSVNGFWASLGPNIPHTAYSAAKFAVKGFSEALINDFRVNAPHLKVSVVMPGHIGTSIAINSSKYFGRDPKEMDEAQIAQLRKRITEMGMDVSGASDDDLRTFMISRQEDFRDRAPMTAAEAATVILSGVKADRWRILVGEDAHRLDELVRSDPEAAYDVDFFPNLIG